MSDRRAHAWGAAIVAAGGLLGATAAWRVGQPGGEWRPLLIGLTAYVASGLLIARWGLEVYGWRGALGAVALTAFGPGLLGALAAPPPLATAGATALLLMFAQLAAAYALTRCLLDPSAQGALLAGLTLAVASVGAIEHVPIEILVSGLAVFSLALTVCRTFTASRCESRPRVARASAVALLLAWLVALAIVLAIAVTSDLPSASEYTRRPQSAAAVLRVAAREPFTTSPAADRPRVASLAALPVAALLLAAARPWRRQRRYSDAGWLAALLCVAAPVWLLGDDPSGVCLAPFAALLAGACWDPSRSAVARRVAVLVVALQALAAVLLWPRYAGSERPYGWSPIAAVGALAPRNRP